MSSPNRSTSDIEDAFSFMNILNYTSVSSDSFPASSESSSFNSSENSTDNIIPPVFSPFYNNPYLIEEHLFSPHGKWKEGSYKCNEKKTELKEIRTRIIKLQKKRLGQKDKIAFTHYRISDLERIIEKTQAYHQTNEEAIFMISLTSTGSESTNS
ncbi:hypothetical protein Tco_0518068 [Tanacetum coccineum]